MNNHEKRTLTDKGGLSQVATATQDDLQLWLCLVDEEEVALQGDPGPVEVERLVGQHVASCGHTR